MMKFKVTYIDGGEDVFAVRPKHLVLAERDGGVEQTMESTFKLAWRASGSADSFEEWLDKVEEINPDNADEPERPTPGE